MPQPADRKSAQGSVSSRAWRIRNAPWSASSALSDIESNESRPLTSNSSLPPLPGSLRVSSNSATAASALVGRFYHGVKQQLRGTENENKKRGGFRHNLHHQQGSKGTDSIRVQIPIRMMLSTLSIFLILPLSMFAWKETHLHPPEELQSIQQNPELRQKNTHSGGRFPTWMDEDTNSVANSSGTTTESTINISTDQPSDTTSGTTVVSNSEEADVAVAKNDTTPGTQQDLTSSSDASVSTSSSQGDSSSTGTVQQEASMDSSLLVSQQQQRVSGPNSQVDALIANITKEGLV